MIHIVIDLAMWDFDTFPNIPNHLLKRHAAQNDFNID